jgi:uncharacterized membrane protein
VTTSDPSVNSRKPKIAKLPIAAAVFALFGLTDAIYLTIHHYTAEAVPCGLEFDCEAVLGSRFADIYGIPLAAFGALGYIAALTLAVLAVSGSRLMWRLFGVQATLMAAISGWLIYVQYHYIHAWCQYCLLSAATSFTLFLIFFASLFAKTQRVRQA